MKKGEEIFTMLGVIKMIVENIFYISSVKED